MQKLNDVKGVSGVSDRVVDFSSCKDLKEVQQELNLFKELYYDLARAAEAAVECGTKRETDKLLVTAQRLAEYKYLSFYEKDIENIEIFMAGFNVDEYLDNLHKNDNE